MLPIKTPKFKQIKNQLDFGRKNAEGKKSVACTIELLTDAIYNS